MITHLNPDVVEMFLVHILAPVYRITEDDSVRDSHMGTFVTTLEMIRSHLMVDRVQMN